MNKAEFLQEIVALSFAYFEATDTEYEVSGFSRFLMDQQLAEEPPQNKLSSEADDLGIRLVLLNRYAREYVKLALETTVLGTADEFSFLITLFAAGSHTKTEVINKMLLTKTSGTEVIKRLLKKKLIREFDDPSDGRSKRIEINDRGKAVLMEVLPRISTSSQLIKGNLTPGELLELNRLLKKLETHHKNVFKDQSKEDLAAHWEEG